MLLTLSFAQPHFRRPHFLAYAFTWGMQHTPVSVDGGLHNTLYCMKKGSRGPDDQPVQLLTYDPVAHAMREGQTHEFMDEEDFLMFMKL